MDVVILWDAARLGAPALGPSQSWWLSDGFFEASPGGINVELDDGDAMYTAWANLGAPVTVTDAGLLCVEMTFTAQLSTGLTVIQIAPSLGQYSQTKVFDGSSPNTDIKGELGSARIIIFPSQTISSVAEAKLSADGEALTLAGPIVTRRFDALGCFYIEDADRAAGIKVTCAPEQIPDEGDTPTILGTIRTVDGERVVEAAAVTAGGAATDLPTPLGITPGRVSVGLSPQGLLVRAWGRVVFTGEDQIVLDDGSPNGLRLQLHGTPTPRRGDYVSVTGALGADTAGPVLRVNNASDVTSYGPP